MINPIKWALSHAGIEVRRIRPAPHSELVSLQSDKATKGNVLLAYIVDPFMLASGEVPSKAHTHHTESLLIARAFLNMGYNVDVIDYRNGNFKPQKNYRFFVSARTSFVEIARHLNSSCIKIAHLDTAHFLFNNAAAYQRLLALQRRRAITATSIRVIEHNFAVEHADYLTVLGNEFDESTYCYSRKPIFRLSVPTPNVYPFNDSKDFDHCKNRYLWFGSTGLVHKGLDLVLEAFSGLSDHHLTVCGPVDDPTEDVFRRAYHRELYETPNICTVGWVDVGSQQFLDIASNCAALIYPSCSEANCGSVITCMQAGLIPLISYESGVDVADFGVILEDCSIDGIKDVVRRLSSTPGPALQTMSLKAYEYARANHTSDAYLRRFTQIIETIEREGQ